MVTALAAALTAGTTALVAESPALAAGPPAGAQISDSLEYVGRVPDSSMIVEGKFDRVARRDVLVTTGRYGFRTYDVSNPAAPRLLDTFQPPEILGPNGYWQDEDMELDVRRKLIIGALDPRHDNVDQASCPGIGTLGSKTRNPGCRSGLPQRPRVPRAVHARWPGGRPADLGHEPQGRGPSGDLPQADRPVAQRRADRLLARRRRRRGRHRVDERARWSTRLREARQMAGPEDGQGPRRQAMGPGPGRRRRHRGRPQRRRPAADRLRPQLDPTAQRPGAGVRHQGRQHRADDRGGLHRA